MKKSSASPEPSASAQVEAKIHSLGDWRGAMLGRVRALIREAVPGVVEECKWRGVPVWSSNGILCTGESYKSVVKLTFAKGASLQDPAGLFNSSLEGNTRRAMDLREGETLDGAAFKALVQEAAALNAAPRRKAPAGAQGASTPAAASASGADPAKPGAAKAAKESRVILLSGGNPQIAKGDGDAPVQAYIAAMPGWKQDIGRRLDALITRAVPGVAKAVRWNSPFYGAAGQGWFVSFHVLTKYVKVTFFNGLSLQPVPPGGTPKSKEARWLDIYEDKGFDEAQMTAWVKQAAALPGWSP